MFAVIRNARVRGRKRILVSSISVINGASQRGVDAGKKDAKNDFMFVLKKINNGASHSMKPNGNVMVGKVVIENVYGISPVRLKKINRQKVGGINMSQPLNDFFHGDICARINESINDIACVKKEGVTQKVGEKKINRDAADKSEQRAKKFILKNPDGSMLEKTLNNIKIWVIPIIGFEGQKFI